MTTNTYRSTAEFARDAADYRSLHAYVDALPEADRIAYFYANPEFTLYGHPAYLVHEAAELGKQGKHDEAVELLRRDTERQEAARYAAHCAAIAPDAGMRAFKAVAGTVPPLLFGGIITLGCAVAGAPHLAAGVAAVAGCFAALGALSGAVAPR